MNRKRSQADSNQSSTNEPILTPAEQYEQLVDACSQLQRILNKSPESPIAFVLRSRFKQTANKLGIRTRPAESVETIFNGLQRIVASVDWNECAEEMASQIRAAGRALRIVTRHKHHRMPGDLGAWFWADALFEHSWVGKNNSPALAKAKLAHKNSESRSAIPTITTKLQDVIHDVSCPELTESQLRIIKCLSMPVSIDELVGLTALEPQQLLPNLTILEIARVIQREGRRIRLKALGKAVLKRIESIDSDS